MSRRSIEIVAVYALLAAGCAHGPASVPDGERTVSPRVQQRYDAALGQLATGEFAAAEQALAGLAETHPGLPGPHANLGLLYARTDRLELAEQALGRALALKPHAATYNALGIVLRRAGRFPEAEAAYSAALDADATYRDAHLNLGVLYDLYLGRPADALTQYTRYVELGGETDVPVDKWLADLGRRVPADGRTAEAGE